MSFDELQNDLDWWGSWQKQDLACRLGHVFTESDNGHKERVYQVHEKMKEIAEQKFSHAYFMLEHIKTQEPTMEI